MVFFFPGISLGVTHSLKFRKSVLFFSVKVGKNKKQMFYFFPGKVYQPLTQNFWDPLFFIEENHVRPIGTKPHIPASWIIITKKLLAILIYRGVY